jgi:acetyl esterase/lipase
VAFTVGSAEAHDRLGVLDLATLRVSAVAALAEADVVDAAWVNDTRLVYSLARDRVPEGRTFWVPGLWAVNADGSGRRELASQHQFDLDPPPGAPLNARTRLVRAPGAPGSSEVIVGQWLGTDGQGRNDIRLLRLDTVTGRSVQERTPPGSIDWLFDARGVLRATYSQQGATGRLHWRDTAQTPWRVLSESTLYLETGLRLLALPDDGVPLVAALHDQVQGGDTLAVFRLDPASGRPLLPPVLAVPGFDLTPEVLQRDGRVLGLRVVVDAVTTVWLDGAMQAHQAAVDRLLPDTSNLLTAPQHGDSPWLLVQAHAEVQPALGFAYHTGERRLVRLGGGLPGLAPPQLGTMDLLRFKARDGLEIPAYLTLPPGVKASDRPRLPLVVWVHGGPWVRGASWRFQPEVQFLASRGYAVLQPEFRGSTGYGQRLFRAGWKQWGRTMQDDLADAARWAAAQGIADPGRVAIMGASYGGYATLMGLINDPDVFRCGVSWVGVTDIALQHRLGWDNLPSEFRQLTMAELVGDPKADAAAWAAVSPLQQASRLKRPLLLAHGGVDRVVRIEHSQRLLRALRAHNRDVEWVEYPLEGHGWWLPQTQIDFWGRVERFLARHLS